MALTAAEQAELAELEKELGGGLSPEEQAELAALEAELGDGPVVEEMHPDIDFMTRAIYKNLGGDPESSFNFLQKRLPNLQLKKSPGGEVLAKRPEEAEWRKLDPSGFDIQDITDVAYDIPAGIAQGAATAAAGLGAGAATGGIAAIPAAMATSAATGTGLEALRQMLGSAAGIEENIDPSALKFAAGAGAVSPLLFGTGAGAQQAIKAVGAERAKQLLSSQRGALGRAYDATAGAVGPKLGALVSGINEKVIKKAADMLPELKLADVNPAVRTEPLKVAKETVSKNLKKTTSQVGAQLDELRNLIDSQPGVVMTAEGVPKTAGTIPSKEFLAPFLDLTSKISETGTATPAQLADAKKLAKIINDEFTDMPEYLTAAQVDTLRKRFKEKAKQFGLNYGKSGQTTSATEGASAIDAQVASAFEESRQRMTDAIVAKLREIAPDKADQYVGLMDEYSGLKTLGKESQSKLKTSKSFSNFLGSAAKNDIDAQQLKDLEKVTGVNLEDLALRDQAIGMFSKAATDIRSLGGTTSTTRSIPLAVAGGAAGYAAAQNTGGEFSPFLAAVLGGAAGSKLASPAALRSYMQMNQAVRQAPSQIPGFRYAPYTLMNVNDER